MTISWGQRGPCQARQGDGGGHRAAICGWRLKAKKKSVQRGAESGVGRRAEFLRGEQGMLGMRVMRYFGRVGSLQVWGSSDVICWLTH